MCLAAERRGRKPTRRKKLRTLSCGHVVLGSRSDAARVRRYVQGGGERALGRDTVLEPGLEGPHQGAGGRVTSSRAAAQELGDEAVHFIVNVW